MLTREILQCMYDVPVWLDSASLVGCYRVVALIRELARWSVDVFQPWYQRRVLGMDSPS